MFTSLLTPLQRRILAVVAGRLDGVFLSGGSALGPFHLGHRRSVDLDLFTRERGAYDTRVRELLRLMDDEKLAVTAGHAGPGFHRFVVTDGTETVPVDVVLDTTPAVGPTLVVEGGLAIDSLTDIAANKLAAVLGRAELRDYVDLYFLEQAGIDLVALLPAARQKDGGLDAATLAFVLSDVEVNADPVGLVRPVSAADLQAFVDDLRRRCARAAFPGER